MRVLSRLAVAASFLLVFAAPIALAVDGAAFAQTKGDTESSGPDAKQVALTQKDIDGIVSAQKDIHAIEAKAPRTEADKPDPKMEADIAAAVKKNGFADVDAFANVSFSVGMVLAGMDPDSKRYVGVQAITKKQMADVQGDKSMSAKDRKEALDELGVAMKQTATVMPMEGNVALVAKNYDSLNAALREDAE
jgi:hypothetical protein